MNNQFNQQLKEVRSHPANIVKTKRLKDYIRQYLAEMFLTYANNDLTSCTVNTTSMYKEFLNSVNSSVKNAMYGFFNVNNNLMFNGISDYGSVSNITPVVFTQLVHDVVKESFEKYFIDDHNNKTTDLNFALD